MGEVSDGPTGGSKGKAKKLTKKAARGEVNTFDAYRECIARGLTARSTIELVPDASRKHCSHDLLVSDLRDLLLALLTDRQPPKHFTVKNRPFIRNIVLIHVCNVSDPSNFLSEVTTMTQVVTKPLVCKVKASKGQEMASMLRKLLTLSEDEASYMDSLTTNEHSVLASNPAKPLPDNTDGEDVKLAEKPAMATEKVEHVANQYADYVLSEASMRTWRYPIPVKSMEQIAMNVSASVGTKRSLDKVSQATDEIAANAKRAFCESTERGDGSTNVVSEKVVDSDVSSTIIGVRIGHHLVPSATLAREMLQLGKPSMTDSSSVRAASADSGFVDIISDGVRRSGFRSTLSAEHYRRFERMTTAAADFPVRADLDHDSHGAAPLHAGVVAVDCEMCQTEEGDTVTRLTLVDHVGRVIVDTLVKPAARIIDYRTQYSGITESLLQDVNVTTEQALATFLRVVSADTVLVGHSLDSDLHALRVCHLRCVDTAILYPHPRGYPYRRKLKVLAEAFLQMVIQRGSGAGSGAGHDSVEDARAAMQLAKLKAEQGWGFGLPRRARDENGEYDTGRMPLLSHCFDSTQPLRTAAITSIPVAKASSEAGAGVDVVCDLGTCLGGGVPVLNVPDAGDGTEADTSAAVSYLCDQLFLDSRISGPVDGDAIGGEVDAAVNLGRRFGCLVLDAAEAGCTQTRDAVQVVQARCRQFMTLPAAQSEGSTNGGDTAETSSMLTSAPSQSAGLCVLLSAQCPEGPARALSRQKRACANPQAAATWSALQEDRLRFEVNKANMAAAAVVLS